MAFVYSIVYQPTDQKYEQRQDNYLRVAAQEVNLITDLGIEGDQKARRHSKRQLNLLSYEWLEKMQAQGFRTKPGDFGEQLILRGLAVEELPSGARLQIGAQAVIEITKPRTGCDRLQAAQTSSIRAIQSRVGMLARVLTGGPIRVGDPVTVLPENQPAS
ncbi:MAG TPA: MOSC domain-containing protein [Anaerolineales bacterium]|nr:MOSC domain-containing protein [Anaerolineales bacterium]